MQNNDNLKLIYSSIIRGYTSFILDRQIYYLKHLSAVDSSDIDIKKREYFEIAVSKGYITYADRYHQLIKNNSWSEEREHQLKDFKDFLGNLHHSKKQVTLQKDKKLYDKDIENYQIKILELELEKTKLIGKTAEDFANRRANEHYIFASLYKDNQLNQRFYNMEEFRDLDQTELDKLVKIYNEKMAEYNDGNLKKVSLLPGFFNLFCLSGEDIVNVFGKPFIDLTFYQIELLTWARQFKNILQNSKTQPPNYLFSDPDKILEWFNLNESKDKMLTNDAQDTADRKVIASANSMIGASEEERKSMGFDDSHEKKIQKALKESKTGEIGFEDLLKMGI